MMLNKRFINSKLGRRIFFMFVFCALMPAATLTFLSFSHVNRQLNEQHYGRLAHSVKIYSTSLLERLMFLEKDLRIVASDMVGGITLQPKTDGLYEDISSRFVGIDHYIKGKGHTALLGKVQNPPEPTAEQYDHMSAGKPILIVRSHSDKLSQIFLMQLISSQNPDSGYIVGEVNPVPFWGIGYKNKLPAQTQLYVLDQSKHMVIGSIPVSPEMISERLTRDAIFPDCNFEFAYEGESFIASYWPLSLKTRYHVEDWTVILSESQSNILIAASEFKHIFLQVVMLSLCIIFLLSIIYIRKNLGPLEALKEGTKRIAERNFSSPVNVTSNDEFKELAASFNLMSAQLDKQFKALITRSDIDRAILSLLDKEKMIETVITNIRKFFSCDAAGFTLMGDEDGKTINYYLKQNGSAIHTESLDSEPRDVEKLRSHPDCLQYRTDGHVPFYLTPVADSSIRSFLILPLFIEDKLSGVIHLGYQNGLSLDAEDMKQARRFADQSAIALSNSNLVETLNQQNLGTLEALARSVDAKSPWTAGHSERVTDLALKIGTALGLDPEQLNIIHRGGLLHDVGKIGVPSAILDKPGKLTDEEFEIIKTHPPLGKRILEPIKSFSDLIPIVVQHHERFDGKGYPQGLAGDAINLGARILAVADTYDAIVSDRSFRKGSSHEKALEIIKDVSGTQFDPKVVKAFLKIAESHNKEIFVQRTVHNPASNIPPG